jgi:hypothetical protein
MLPVRPVGGLQGRGFGGPTGNLSGRPPPHIQSEAYFSWFFSGPADGFLLGSRR